MPQDGHDLSLYAEQHANEGEDRQYVIGTTLREGMSTGEGDRRT